MRKKIVAGNWKMNNDNLKTKALIQSLNDALENVELSNTDVVIAPTFVNLESAVELVNEDKMSVSAQNMHHAENGAYTGEISATMLKAIGVNTVILGHSERRAYFNEDASLLTRKVEQALQHKMNIIFCFGEVLEDRKDKNHFNIVEYQLKDALFNFSENDWENIVLAYEPVWAIGTGETASPAQAQEMHAFIRKLIRVHYNDELAQKVSILYGGSVKPGNASEIFSQKDVDGGLIGGAALNADDFMAIVKAI